MNLELNPQVLAWARQRAGLSAGLLADKLKVATDRVETWERTGQLRYRQAELLVPAKLLRSVWPQAQGSAEPYQFLARHFKVSPIVAARRAQDLALISRNEYLQFHRAYEADERRNKSSKSDGGDFWNTQNVRLGARFGAAVVRATKEGRLLYRDAYRLTGLRGTTFEKFAKSVGVDLR
ncbi:ImmA/IrrE family metallo-endopeptidase [Halochromatium glycolicum]|uniref:Uncharacterized protein n=1 Tax=Halochromatium glycolicum TaxID=85075 RepID=A0AAJ0U3C0_9GAMM|nr:hypothetical protein [Halochromatium glycolicum]MBK1704520.1 hypothetical protein [Halochromatium glycolicum]